MRSTIEDQIASYYGWVEERSSVSLRPSGSLESMDGIDAAGDSGPLAHLSPAPMSGPIRGRGRTIGLVAAVLIGVLALAGGLLVVNRRDPQRLTPTDSPPTATTPVTTTLATEAGSGSAFAAAIEASAVLTSPSADEVAQAMDDALYRGDEGTQVSAAGNFVSLRMCRVDSVSTCGTGWSYMTSSAGSVEMRGGLLGEASQLVDLHLLDDRYFVASDRLPDGQAPSRAWLIDAVSGQAGVLRWRDEPTTLNSPEQALLLCQDSYDMQCGAINPAPVDELDVGLVALGGVPTAGGLPKVVDARDGTIRPLALPDDVVAGVSVAQHGTGRIWVGTAPDGDTLGLAYTDDGGATWIKVALPAQLDATRQGLSSEDGQLTIAADRDRIAVAKLWQADTVYVSDDAGQSWSNPTPSEPPLLGSGPYVANGAHLYVLADGRLVLAWSYDVELIQALASTNSGWGQLERIDGIPTPQPERLEWSHFFTVNRAGNALVPSFLDACFNSCRGFDDSSPVLDTIDYSPDLTNWTTIEILDD